MPTVIRRRAVGGVTVNRQGGASGLSRSASTPYPSKAAGSAARPADQAAPCRSRCAGGAVARNVARRCGSARPVRRSFRLLGLPLRRSALPGSLAAWRRAVAGASPAPGATWRSSPIPASCPGSEPAQEHPADHADQEAARRAEQETERPVERADPRIEDQVGDLHRDDRDDDQRDEKIAANRRGKREGAVVDVLLDDRAGASGGGTSRSGSRDPGDDGQNLAREAAHGSEQGGNQHDAEDDEVEEVTATRFMRVSAVSGSDGKVVIELRRR